MRETAVRVTSVVTCDRCGVRGEAGATVTMTADETVPLLNLYHETRQEAAHGFTLARVGIGSPQLDLCEPCVNLVRTALTPTRKEDDR